MLSGMFTILMSSCLENSQSNSFTDDKGNTSFRFLKLHQKGLISYIPTIDSFFQDNVVYDDSLLLADIKRLDHHHLAQKDSTAVKFVFQNYVLPYKLFSERTEDWRRLVRMKYSGIAIAKDSSDYVPITRKVVEEIRGWFKFSSIAGPVYAMTYGDLLARGGGDCISESKLGAYCLRALGVPVSLDFTCSFGNMDGSLHMWNSIVYAEGVSVPFMAAETPPYDYNPFTIIINKDEEHLTTYKKCAKIFRRTYQLNISEIDFSHQPWLVPEVIKDNRFIDITDLYQPVSDVRYDVSRHQSVKDSVGYICVYNKGDWKPAYWSTLKNDSTWLFPKMGRDLLYIVGTYIDKRFIPISYPFILESNGKLKFLTAQMKLVSEMKIKSLASPLQMQFDTIAKITDGNSFDRIMADMAKGKTVMSPTPGLHYELQIWKGEWCSFEIQQCSHKGLIFTNVPSRGLYRIKTVNQGSSKTRPFSYDTTTAQQIWF